MPSGLAALLFTLAFTFGSGVAHAATTTAPYTTSGTQLSCSPAIACTTLVGADHSTGELAVDLALRGGAAYEAGYCTGGFVCHPNVGDAWGDLTAYVIATQTIVRPVAAVDFTVTVGTGNATASTEGASAFAFVELHADANGDTCTTCRGYEAQTLASSSASLSAAPATRTLRLTYKDNLGGKVPAGTVRVYVALRGYTSAGVGSAARAQATATVNGVSSTIRA